METNDCRLRKTNSAIFYNLNNTKNNNNKSIFHIFITGKGGFGKTFLIKVITQYVILKHRICFGHTTVCIVAPTEMAALNIHGKTVHSAIKLPVQDLF